jgi:hypothetical protein
MNKTKEPLFKKGERVVVSKKRLGNVQMTIVEVKLGISETWYLLDDKTQYEESKLRR